MSRVFAALQAQRCGKRYNSSEFTGVFYNCVSIGRDKKTRRPGFAEARSPHVGQLSGKQSSVRHNPVTAVLGAAEFAPDGAGQKLPHLLPG
jgi:hypothetical protein